MFARGARPTDRLCVFDPSESGDYISGCIQVSPGQDRLDLVEVSGWRPEVRIEPDGENLSLELRLPKGLTSQDTQVEARLYPDGSPALTSITLTKNLMTEQGLATYTRTLSLDEPVFNGYLWVKASQCGVVGLCEIITDFAVGGNPVLMQGRHVLQMGRHVLQRGRHVNLRARQAPVSSADGQVVIYVDDTVAAQQDKQWLLTIQPVTFVPQVPPWATVVGKAYWLHVAPKEFGLGESSISFEYLGSDVAPDEEPFLRIYRWDEEQRQWIALAGRFLDLDQNVISAPLTRPGLYALMTSIELPIQSGWNLIGYPVQTAGVPTATRPISDVLASIKGAYSVVYGYDATDTRDPWKLYAPQGGVQSDLATLEFGHGYWLHITAPQLITATSAITLHLRGSWPGVKTENPLSGPTPLVGAQQRHPPTTFSGHLTATATFAPTAGMQVLARVEGETCGEGRTYGDGSSIGYQVTVDVSGREGTGRCGGPGSQVVFYVVDGREMSPRAVWGDGGLQFHDLVPSPTQP